MNISCLHTHTLFCDGKGEPEDFCQAAFKKGLCAIGFSAHGPITQKTGISSQWHLPEDRLDAYIEAVLAARRRWQGKLAVYLGLEMDYIKGMRSALDADIQALPLDYIIGSVHYVVPPKGGPFAVDGSPEEVDQGVAEGFGGDKEAMMHSYWDAMEEMTALGGFDIIGHADLVKKNNKDNRLFDMHGGAYLERLAGIARAAASGPVVEVNTGGINRGRISETYPSSDFLRLFREQGVPAVITADAHEAGHVDGNYDTARRTMIEAGYTEHVLFEGRKNGKAVWKSEKMEQSGSA